MTYNAVKAAEISLAKSLAQQLASSNIRVNSVSPGWMRLMSAVAGAVTGASGAGLAATGSDSVQRQTSPATSGRRHDRATRADGKPPPRERRVSRMIFLVSLRRSLADNGSMFEAPDYATSLRNFVADYEGARQQAVRLAPEDQDAHRGTAG